MASEAMEGCLFDFARRVALDTVCPLSGETKTVFEINAVKMFTEYGVKLLRAWNRRAGEEQDANE